MERWPRKKRGDLKKRTVVGLRFFLFILLTVSGVTALIATGGVFQIEKFFMGIAGEEISGGNYTARYHSTAFQPIGKASGEAFTATIGPLSSTKSLNITTNASYPGINSYLIMPYAVINGSSILIRLSATNTDFLYAEIIKPDYSFETINLTNNENVTFSNTSLVGKYNITIYANNSQGSVNVSDYFESLTPLQFHFNVIDFNATGVNSSWELYYRNQLINFNDSSTGNHLSIFPDTISALKLKSYSDRLQIILEGINVTLENGKSFGIDKLTTSVSGYLSTYGINNSYNITNATVRIYYDDASFTTEGNLKFDKCDDWDFTSQSCSGSFADITSSAIQNTAENYFEYITTSFSGFGIREVSSISGDNDTGSSGGGGGSSCTYTQSYDWGCSEWSVCTNEIQTRTCKEKNNCGSIFGRPETQRVCTIEAPELSPAELFDIFLELEDASLTSSSELVARIRFESFGTIPTHVDLTYIIVDSLDNEVYREKGEIVVETEEILTKQFKDLNLPYGKYTLVLTTLYGDNIEDQFRQEFEVRNEKINIWWIYLAGALLIVFILVIGVYIAYRKRKHGR